ncbi:predicted protein [Nematostella vectensis]|uniref:Uncharacterized protein n=1 Tax=Nematostella vectensis TaxID=45351 RepID=A7SLW4_NEMVE|nr:predicted protein [Nematostella vectensis]|eukprot:XP_001627408.1 predicted protein [Nematostella vectensis]
MGASTSKSPSPLEPQDDFTKIDNYTGSYKDGKRHGYGVYYFANGDIYDGQWRKGRKEGYGKYVFAKGESNIGWFYRDEYVGKEPNEKLRRKMKKRNMSIDEEGPDPIPRDSSLVHTETTNIQGADSDKEDDSIPKLKDPTGLDFRRAESVRRQKFYRAKYNIPDKNSPGNGCEAKDSVRAKWGLSRSKPNSNASFKDKSKTYAKDPKLLTAEEEAEERRRSKRLRESIRAKYKLRS